MIRPDLLKFNGYTEMNERKIIDRKFFADLAKEVGLNASHLEALGESRQWEIVRPLKKVLTIYVSENRIYE